MSKPATTTDVLARTARWAVECADCIAFLRSLPDASIHCCMTSPPYFGLRDYGVTGQIGLETSPAKFVAKLVAVFEELRRALHPSGTLWLNMGDSYNARAGQRKPTDMAGAKQRTNTASCGVGSRFVPEVKPKDLLGIPWLLAFALRDAGWYLRSDIIWHKPSAMPSSVRDRCTTAHEYLFMLAKSPRYYFDAEAIAEKAKTAGKPIKMADGWDTGLGGHGAFHCDGREAGTSTGAIQAATRNKRSVWRITSRGYKGAHFATFPKKLVEPCILAGTSAKGVCPECGAPWTRKVKRVRAATRPGTNTKVAAEAMRLPSEEPGRAPGAARFEKSTLMGIIGNRDPERHCTTTETVGWYPGCKCDAGEPVPAIVCDPFTGSGTVAAVAVGFGRRFVGSELNPAYHELIRRRMSTVTPAMPGIEE